MILKGQQNVFASVGVKKGLGRTREGLNSSNENRCQEWLDGCAWLGSGSCGTMPSQSCGKLDGPVLAWMETQWWKEKNRSMFGDLFQVRLSQHKTSIKSDFRPEENKFWTLFWNRSPSGSKSIYFHKRFFFILALWQVSQSNNNIPWGHNFLLNTIRQVLCHAISRKKQPDKSQHAQVLFSMNSGGETRSVGDYFKALR